MMQINLPGLFFILFTGSICFAADDPPEIDLESYERPHYEISKAPSPVKVDAVLDDEAWASALEIDLP